MSNTNSNASLTIRIGTQGVLQTRQEVVSLSDAVRALSRSTTALQGVGGALGSYWSPAVFAPISEVAHVLKNLRVASAAAGVGMGTLGVALAGIGTAVVAGVFGWKAYQAELKATEAGLRSVAMQMELNQTLIESLRQNAGRLPPGVADSLTQRLTSASPDAAIERAKAQLAGIDQSRANLFQMRRISGIPDVEIEKEFAATFGKKIDELKAVIAKPPLAAIQREATGKILSVQQDAETLRNLERIGEITRDARVGALQGFAKERAEAESGYSKRMAELERLRVQNPNEKELRDAAIAWNALIVERDAKLSEINQREQESRTKAMLDERAYWQEKERKADAFYAHEDELERRQREQRMERLRQEAIASVRDNFGMTETEKYSRLSALGVTGLGPDPSSFSQNFSAGITQLANSWNTAKNLATAAIESVQLAVSGVSDAISGAILGTKTWGQVFAQVGASIISSLVNVVVQWVANMTIIAALKRLFGVKDNAQAAQSAAAWAPAAIAASIASYGAAAAIGTAAYLTAMGTGTALTAGLSAGAGVSGFAAGGRPPVGRVSIVGERGPELFVPDAAGRILPANVTQRIVAEAGGLAGAAVNNEITFAPIMDPQTASEYLREHTEAIAWQVFQRELRRYRV